MRLRSVAAVAAVLTLGVAAACGGNGTPSENSQQNGNKSSATAKPGDSFEVVLDESAKGPAKEVEGAQTGGKVTILTQQAPESFDPTIAYYVDSLSVLRLTNRTLTALALFDDGKYHLVPDLGTDLGKPNDDFTEWTFKVKPGQKFEDGTPITSKDFAYSVKRSFATEELPSGPTYQQIYFLDGDKYKGPFKTAAQGGGPDYKGVETPDDETLIVKMAKPWADLPYYMTFPVYSPIPEAKDTKENYGNHPIASGPYKFKTYQKGKSLVLEKNTNWDPNSDPVRHQYADEFEFKLAQDALKLQEQLVADNGIDQTSLTYDNLDSSLLPKIQGKPDIEERLLSSDGTCNTYLYLDTRKITDLEVRKAMAVAFPFDSTHKAGGDSPLTYVAGTTSLPKVTPGWQDFDVIGNKSKGDGDPVKAKEMLEAAGKLNFEVVWAVRQDQPISVQVSTVRKNALEKAGFKVKIIPMPTEQYRAELDNPESAINVRSSGWCLDWPSAATVFPAIFDPRLIALNKNSAPNKSFLGYDPASEEYKFMTEEIDRISALPITDAAAEWAKLDKTMMEKYFPIIPIDFSKNAFLIGSKIGGAVADPYQNGPDLTKLFVKK